MRKLKMSIVIDKKYIRLLKINSFQKEKTHKIR